MGWKAASNKGVPSASLPSAAQRVMTSRCRPIDSARRVGSVL
jgi:hypothetical protein